MNPTDDELRKAAAELLAAKPFMGKSNFATALGTTRHRLDRLAIPQPKPMHPKIISQLSRKAQKTAPKFVIGKGN